jgi:hypothetical protein
MATATPPTTKTTAAGFVPVVICCKNALDEPFYGWHDPEEKPCSVAGWWATYYLDKHEMDRWMARSNQEWPHSTFYDAEQDTFLQCSAVLCDTDRCAWIGEHHLVEGTWRTLYALCGGVYEWGEVHDTPAPARASQ